MLFLRFWFPVVGLPVPAGHPLCRNWVRHADAPIRVIGAVAFAGALAAWVLGGAVAGMIYVQQPTATRLIIAVVGWLLVPLALFFFAFLFPAQGCRDAIEKFAVLIEVEASRLRAVPLDSLETLTGLTLDRLARNVLETEVVHLGYPLHPDCERARNSFRSASQTAAAVGMTLEMERTYFRAATLRLREAST